MPNVCIYLDSNTEVIYSQLSIKSNHLTKDETQGDLNMKASKFSHIFTSVALTVLEKAP